MSTAQLDQRSTVPKDYEFHLNELEIRENGNQVILTFPKRDWKEAMARQEQKAKSTDTTVNLEPVMKKMKGQMVIKIVNTAAEQALTTRPDPRDAIPLTYCDKTRRIVALVGFVVSSATILGVHMAAIADRVPGFQPLTIFDPTKVPESIDSQIRDNLMGIGMPAIGLIFFGVCMGYLRISVAEDS
jgi:hypothetical protein